MAQPRNTETSRDEIINALLNAQPQINTAGDTLRELVTDAIASSLDTSAAIVGALTGAWDNAKQIYTLEQQFRSAERAARAKLIAGRYADRLIALSR